MTSLRAFAASTSEIDAPDFRFWYLADIQPTASRGPVPVEKRTCLISVQNVR